MQYFEYFSLDLLFLPQSRGKEQQHFSLSLLSCFGYSKYNALQHAKPPMRAFIPAFRLALDIVQTRTKPYQAEVVNEHRQSLIFLTDIISRALFIFRRPPLEGLFCGANTNGLDFVGFQFVLCLRVLIKEPVSLFCNTVLLQLVCLFLFIILS